MMASFSPRVLITGGGLGIGYATVEFLVNKYNARVVVFTLDYDKELEALLQKYESEKRLFVIKGDVTSVSVYKSRFILFIKPIRDICFVKPSPPRS
jgi:NAD(P)-dependent dehydrogenase (short-subunit alcohol dehydrogenase family)